MEAILNKKQVRCRQCYQVHALFYIVHRNNTVHLAYYCDFSIRHGNFKPGSKNSKGTMIKMKFVPELPIPFTSTDILVEEKKQSKEEHKKAQKELQPSLF